VTTSLPASLPVSTLNPGAPGPTLLAWCLQGHSLSSVTLEAWGERLARLHHTPQPISHATLNPEAAWQHAVHQSALGVWLQPDAEAALTTHLPVPMQRLWQRWQAHQPEAFMPLACNLLQHSWQGPINDASPALPLVVPCSGPQDRLLLSQGQGWQLNLTLSPLPNYNTAWELGHWLAWLPLLGYANYSGQNLAQPFAKQYLATLARQLQPTLTPYDTLRCALHYGGLWLVTMLLTPTALPWITDTYLKETLMHEASAMMWAPHRLSWVSAVAV
jgi:hypothetical protein